MKAASLADLCLPPRRSRSRRELKQVALAAYVQAVVADLLARARRDQRGQTMAEYAVILALITVAVLAALLFLGGRISGVIERIGSVIAS